MSPDAEPQLKRNSLGLPELVFQGVTHIAPATNIVFTFPIIALQAGPDMPLSFLLSTIVCFFIGNTVSQFSRYMPSSGGYYSFATRGLGGRSGFMATWSYLIYEILGSAGCTGFLGYLISDMLKMQFRISIPWWSFALAASAIVWALTHRGVQLSARITALLGGLELLIMLALAITFLIHPAPGSDYLAPLKPASSPHHFGGILAGMVFSILALSGFEAPAPLAQEARLPNKFIGQAIMLSLGTIGVFYIFTSYASAIGWGTGGMAAFASNPNPYYVLGHALWGAGWWFVVLAIVNSAIGVGLACTNAASRVMYTMGRAGTLPANFGCIHLGHGTPMFAIAFVQISGIAAILLVGLLLRPDYIFGFLEAIATLAVIVLYAMANLALTLYMRREQRANFTVWRHMVAPWVATLALLPVLFVTVSPEPAWPYNLTPYLFVIALLVGFAYMQWRESCDPGVLRRGASMLTRIGGAQEVRKIAAVDFGDPHTTTPMKPMKNLFEAARLEEVKERVRHLRPDSERQWGAMNAAQALAHCSASFELASGERLPPRMMVGRIIGRMVKPMVLGNDDPLRRNSPTVEGLMVNDERNLDTEQERLCGLIDRFAAAGPGGCTTHPHSFFGRLTPSEWAILMYKHLDHHLRQFGV